MHTILNLKPKTYNYQHIIDAVRIAVTVDIYEINQLTADGIHATVDGFYEIGYKDIVIPSTEIENFDDVLKTSADSIIFINPLIISRSARRAGILLKYMIEMTVIHELAHAASAQRVSLASEYMAEEVARANVHLLYRFMLAFPNRKPYIIQFLNRVIKYEEYNSVIRTFRDYLVTGKEECYTLSDEVIDRFKDIYDINIAIKEAMDTARRTEDDVDYKRYFNLKYYRAFKIEADEAGTLISQVAVNLTFYMDVLSPDWREDEHEIGFKAAYKYGLGILEKDIRNGILVRRFRPYVLPETEDLALLEQ